MQTCLAFPNPKADGVKQNIQIPEPLDFLAEFTLHIPPKSSHLFRDDGWYSNRSRGVRSNLEAVSSIEGSPQSLGQETTATGSSPAWVMLNASVTTR